MSAIYGIVAFDGRPMASEPMAQLQAGHAHWGTGAVAWNKLLPVYSDIAILIGIQRSIDITTAAYKLVKSKGERRKLRFGMPASVAG